MLRIIVISLVVANLLLLGFQASKPNREQEQGPVVARDVVEDADIPTIHLFGELAQDQELMFGNRQCFSLGPFHSTEERDNLRVQLRGIVTGISERQTQATVEKGYWVFLPPAASLLEANRLLLSIRALGVEDAGIMYDGEWKNAISLGYYQRQGNANRRVRQMEERGYEPQVQVRRQAELRYWLDYEQGPGADLLVPDIQDRPVDLMQRVLPCPELGFFSKADMRTTEIIASGENPEAKTDTDEVSAGGSG